MSVRFGLGVASLVVEMCHLVQTLRKLLFFFSFFFSKSVCMPYYSRHTILAFLGIKLCIFFRAKN